MTAVERLSGVVLLPTDGSPAGLPVDVLIADGLIAAIEPAARTPARRLLAMPALVNAHDHARPLSPTSFGAAGKPLETWLLRLAAMPAIDPYLGALAAFGRAARGGRGLGDGALHPPSRAHAAGRGSPRDRPRRRRCRRARHASPCSCATATRSFTGRPSAVLAGMPAEARATVEAHFLGADAEPGRAGRARRGDRGGGRERDIHRAVRPQRPAMVLGRVACARSRKPPRGPAGASHAFAGDPLSARLRRRRLSARASCAPRRRSACCRRAPDPGPLRPCAPRRARRDRPRPARSSRPTRAPTCICARGIAPIGEALQRGCRVALGVDASAFDEDDDILREMRLGHFLHGGWGFESVVERAPWLAAIVAQRPLRQRRAGDGRAAGRRARRRAGARSRPSRPRRDHAGRADRPCVRARDRRACRRAYRRGRASRRRRAADRRRSRRGGSETAPAISRASRRRGRRSWRPGSAWSPRSRNFIEAASAAADGSRRVAHHAGHAAHRRSRIIGRKR